MLRKDKEGFTLIFVFVFFAKSPSLTWRDVQHLIAHSSNSDVPRSGDWMKNSAGMWGE